MLIIIVPFKYHLSNVHWLFPAELGFPKSDSSSQIRVDKKQRFANMQLLPKVLSLGDSDW